MTVRLLQCDFCPTHFDTNCRPMEISLEGARKMAESHGWTVAVGMDLCPDCTRKLNGGLDKRPKTKVIEIFVETYNYKTRQKIVPINK